MDRTIEPRLNQVFVPLLSIIDDQRALDDLRQLARRISRPMTEQNDLPAAIHLVPGQAPLARGIGAHRA